HPHGRAINLTRSCRKGFSPRPALPENLEGRNALHAVEKVRAQSSIGCATPAAALLTEPEKNCGSHQGKDGEKEKDHGHGQVDSPYETKNNHRRQRGNDHLGEKLTEEKLQALDAFA